MTIAFQRFCALGIERFITIERLEKGERIESNFMARLESSVPYQFPPKNDVINAIFLSCSTTELSILLLTNA